MFSNFFKSLVELFDDQSDWIQWAVIAGCLGFTFVIKKAVSYYFDRTNTKFERICQYAFAHYDGLRTYPCILVGCLIAALITVPLLDLESHYIEVILRLFLIWCQPTAFTI